MKPTPSATHLVELLDAWCQRVPEQVLFRFLADGTNESGALSVSGLWQDAQRVATALKGRVHPGDRVLLLLPQGLDFLRAWFGCMMCRAIAVPSGVVAQHLPERWLPRTVSIINNCRPSLILSTRPVIHQLSQKLSAPVPALDIQEARTTPADLVVAGGYRADDIAWIQYTSGSTSDPSGVVITMGCAVGHCEYLRRGLRYETDSRAVVWCPPYHDDGLVQGLMQTVYNGHETILLPPEQVIGQPIQWLSAISRYRATHAGGPNFAYEIALRKVRDENLPQLDLSSWRIAYNAAEPVRWDTLNRFAARFAGCGFSREAILPAYGMAEATLLVTARRPDQSLRALHLDRTALERGQVTPLAGPDARAVVSCGSPGAATEVCIVDPQTCRLTDEVGEIWVRGPWVASAYWGRPDDPALSSQLAPSGEGPFLRTGDLGFLEGGELFVTGRRKDMIIIAGENRYPQDIELSAEASHTALRSGCSAAFAVDVDDEEKLVLVMEMDADRAASAPEIEKAVQHAVASRHGVTLSTLVLVQPQSILKTPSGKIQRRATRTAFVDGTLKAIARFDRRAAEVPPDPQPAADLGIWLRRWLAARTGVSATAIPPDLPLASLGLSSIAVAELAAELSSWLGRTVPVTFLYSYPTPDALTRALTAPTRTALPPPSVTVEPVAVVGMACRLPGAEDVATFWAGLCAGHDAVSEVPRDRWDVQSLAATIGSEARFLRHGGFLRTYADFDADFFQIREAEAQRMDPQQRLSLELVWEALEDAGIPASRLAGSDTAVFTGICNSDYQAQQYASDSDIDAWGPTGGSYAVAANRVSYFFDLRGPSMAIDTACSSSLVAVHEACQALHSGRSSLALAIGVNLILRLQPTLALSRAGLILASGRCRSFDADADGFVRGEGAAVVVLKPLSRALADGDRIHAVLRGSAVNQDGRSNGLMAPSGVAHEEVVRAACRAAGVLPGKLGYVEAHGAGSSVGDAIEATALGTVLSEGRQGPPCLLGSVKSNLGHLEAAGGIVGLIKTVLILREGCIPPSLHFQRPNPGIPFTRLPLQVVTQRTDWPAEDRLAGVHAFGFGGTNAHVVLASPPRTQARRAQAGPLLLLISAADASALDIRIGQVGEALQGRSDEDAADLCATLAARRAHLPFRYAAVGRGPQALRRLLTARQPAPRHAAAVRPTLVFAGSDGARTAMGLRLRVRSAEFASVVARGEALLGAAAPQLSPAALFLWQAGLTALLRGCGVEPAGAVGYGVGAVSAAWARGELDLGAALKRLEGPGPYGPTVAALAPQLRALGADRSSVLVDISPAPTTALRDAAGATSWIVMGAWDEDEEHAALCGLGALYMAGAELNWHAIWIGQGRPVDLPSYPFQRVPFPLRSRPMLAPAGAAAPAGSALDIVLQLLAEVLGKRAVGVDANTPLASLGMDSVMAMDLRSRVARRLGIELPVLTMLRAATPADLARAASAPSASAVDALSDAEVAAMLTDLMTEGNG